ncbi:hypothetical protein [Streptomyces sp. SYSU K21746]
MPSSAADAPLLAVTVTAASVTAEQHQAEELDGLRLDHFWI